MAWQQYLFSYEGAASVQDHYRGYGKGGRRFSAGKCKNHPWHCTKQEAHGASQPTATQLNLFCLETFNLN